MTVAACVGGRLRVGMGGKVSVRIASVVNSVVGLASRIVGKANCGVTELVVDVGNGRKVGVGEAGMCAWVGNCVGFAGTQAVKKKKRLMVRKNRCNIRRL